MKDIIAFIAFLLLFSTFGMAQKPVLDFDSTEHDFGKVMEENGPVTYKFIFTNTGSSNLKITNVRTACGCTTSEWSTDSIKPGMMGFVNATYNVTHRPGSFVKPVFVFSNSRTDSIVLKLKGEVIRQFMTLADSFPYQLGHIWFKENRLNFKWLTNKLIDTSANIFLVNSSETAITITRFDSKDSDFVYVKDLPLTVPPHSKVLLPVHYNPGKVNDYGPISAKAFLITTDTKMPKKVIFITADIHQYVPKMSSEQLSNAPRLTFKDKAYNFGDIKPGEIKSTSFTFTNDGKTNLKIYKIKGNFGYIVAPLAKTELAPGESGSIDIKFDSNNKKGIQAKPIIVYSNDPVNPECVLKVKSNVIAN